MSRITYLIVLFVPFIMLGGFNKFPTHILPFLVIFHIPTITIFRMIYLKFSWKEILKSLIPIYGLKYQIKAFTEK